MGKPLLFHKGDGKTFISLSLSKNYLAAASPDGSFRFWKRNEKEKKTSWISRRKEKKLQIHSLFRASPLLSVGVDHIKTSVFVNKPPLKIIEKELQNHLNNHILELASSNLDQQWIFQTGTTKGKLIMAAARKGDCKMWLWDEWCNDGKPRVEFLDEGVLSALHITNNGKVVFGTDLGTVGFCQPIVGFFQPTNSKMPMEKIETFYPDCQFLCTQSNHQNKRILREKRDSNEQTFISHSLYKGNHPQLRWKDNCNTGL